MFRTLPYPLNPTLPLGALSSLTKCCVLPGHGIFLDLVKKKVKYLLSQLMKQRRNPPFPHTSANGFHSSTNTKCLQYTVVAVGLLEAFCFNVCDGPRAV